MKHRISRLLSLPCGALTILAGANAPVRADAAAAPVVTADAPGGQAQLDGALARLALVAPKMDAKTRALLPQLRAIITRVCLHPESATPTETKIAAAFVKSDGGRGLFDDAAQDLAVTAVQTSVQQVAVPTIEFVAAQDSLPGGRKKGIVYLKNPEAPRPTELVEIPSGTLKMPVDKRAQVVARRLQQAHNSDPLWWSHMDVQRINNQVVVTVQGAKDPYVITADREFARLQGTTPEQLAYNMMDKIRTTVDPSPTGGRDVVPDSDLQTAQDKLERANLYRQVADDAYSQKNVKKAEKYYLRAASLSPTYAVPYLRLADLYAEQGQGDKAKAILTQAGAVAEMTAEDRAAITGKLRVVARKFVSNG